MLRLYNSSSLNLNRSSIRSTSTQQQPQPSMPTPTQLPAAQSSPKQRPRLVTTSRLLSQPQTHPQLPPPPVLSSSLSPSSSTSPPSSSSSSAAAGGTTTTTTTTTTTPTLNTKPQQQQQQHQQKSQSPQHQQQKQKQHQSSVRAHTPTPPKPHIISVAPSKPSLTIGPIVRKPNKSTAFVQLGTQPSSEFKSLCNFHHSAAAFCSVSSLPTLTAPPLPPASIKLNSHAVAASTTVAVVPTTSSSPSSPKSPKSTTNLNHINNSNKFIIVKNVKNVNVNKPSTPPPPQTQTPPPPSSSSSSSASSSHQRHHHTRHHHQHKKEVTAASAVEKKSPVKVTTITPISEESRFVVKTKDGVLERISSPTVNLDGRHVRSNVEFTKRPEKQLSGSEHRHHHQQQQHQQQQQQQQQNGSVRSATNAKKLNATVIVGPVVSSSCKDKSKSHHHHQNNHRQLNTTTTATTSTVSNNNKQLVAVEKQQQQVVSAKPSSSSNSKQANTRKDFSAQAEFNEIQATLFSLGTTTSEKAVTYKILTPRKQQHQRKSEHIYLTLGDFNHPTATTTTNSSSKSQRKTIPVPSTATAGAAATQSTTITTDSKVEEQKPEQQQQQTAAVQSHSHSPPVKTSAADTKIFLDRSVLLSDLENNNSTNNEDNELSMRMEIPRKTSFRDEFYQPSPHAIMQSPVPAPTPLARMTKAQPQQQQQQQQQQHQQHMYNHQLMPQQNQQHQMQHYHHMAVVAPRHHYPHAYHNQQQQQQVAGAAATQLVKETSNNKMDYLAPYIIVPSNDVVVKPHGWLGLKVVACGMNKKGKLPIPKANYFIDKGDFGDDAGFWCENAVGDAIGIADGASGNIMLGYDPGDFSRNLMRACCEFFSRENRMSDAKSLLLKAYDVVQDKTCYGSSTACVLTLDHRNNLMTIANVGDSGYCLFRNGKLVLRSIPQRITFDCPKQLDSYPWKEASRRMGINYTNILGSEIFLEQLLAQKDDVVLLSSDGLFDNMDDHEIEEVFQKSKTVLDAAETLVYRSVKYYRKPDDILVLIGKVVDNKMPTHHLRYSRAVPTL